MEPRKDGENQWPFSNPMLLVGEPDVADVAGKYLGECVFLVKNKIPALSNRSSSTWIAGPNVMEALKDGRTIIPGTAIATFKHGRFESGNGHAALFAGYIKDGSGDIRITIVEQYLGGKPSGKIISRTLRNQGKKPDGSYYDASNNGEAFSVIQ